jgi:hypothetical protein
MIQTLIKLLQPEQQPNSAQRTGIELSAHNSTEVSKRTNDEDLHLRPRIRKPIVMRRFHT